MAFVPMPSEASPSVTIRVAFDAGSADDPAGLEGIAQMAVRLVVEGGTETMSYPELVRRLFPLAAEMDWQADRDQTVVVARVHRDLLEEFYPVFLEVLTRPRMAAADFERLRAASISELEADLKASDDEELGKEALQAFIYEGHPYGHPPVGTRAGLDAMTVEAVRAHRARTLCAGRATVGVAGGYPERFAERLEADLRAGLPRECAARAPLPPPPAFEGRRVLIVEKPGNRATAISIGFPIDVRRDHPDYPALALATVWFGQHRQFVGRLMREIREERGFNYGDYAYCEHFRQAGRTRFPEVNVSRRRQMFSIWIRPLRPDHARFVLRLAMREHERFVTAGLPPEELDAVRTFALGYFNLYRQTESRRLGFAIDDRFHGLDRPFLDGLMDAWPSVTADQVRSAVARALTADHVKIAIVAPDGEALADEIASDSPSPMTYETPKAPEILAEDAEIEAYPLRIPRDAIRVIPVAEIFAR